MQSAYSETNAIGVAPQLLEASTVRWFDVAVGTAVLFLTTGAVNLQMPLYNTYAASAGLGNTLKALVFATYVTGLLPTLLLFGGLSDRVGRKWVMFGGLLSALLATSLMMLAPGIRSLFVARVLQGIGVGLCMGSGSAFLAECLERSGVSGRSVHLVTASTSLGFGGGALVTGTILVFSHTTHPWSYGAFATAMLLCLVLVPSLSRTPIAGGALMRLPHFSKGTLVANISISTAWAVTGVVISLIPGQLAQRGLSAWAGHALFLVNGTGAVLQPLARKMSVSKSLQMGFLLLPIGYFCLLAGGYGGSLLLVLVGASIAGSACYGFTYLGGLGQVTRSNPQHRARAVSGYFLCAYLGFGLPSVCLGLFADRFGLLTALVGFGVVVLLACVLLANLARNLNRALPRAL